MEYFPGKLFKSAIFKTPSGKKGQKGKRSVSSVSFSHTHKSKYSYGYSYLGKLLLILLLLLLAAFMLAGCDNGFFGDEEGDELRDQMPEWGVREVVEAHYRAIEGDDDDFSRADLMKSTLHPEEEIEVELQFEEEKFYENNVEASYSRTREEYASGYEDYFSYYVSSIEKEKEHIDISDDEAEYVAEVSKEIDNDEGFSYELTMNLKLFETEWYIYSIVKEE